MSNNSLVTKLFIAWQARENCRKSGNTEWETRWTEEIEKLSQYLPSGSGVDSGTKIVGINVNGRQKIVFSCDFHHMDSETGCYDGWTHHYITVRPTFANIDVTVTGPNRNDIKDYLGELYHQALSQEIVSPIVDTHS